MFVSAAPNLAFAAGAPEPPVLLYAAVLGIAVALVGLAFMAGQALHSPHLEAWAKAEAREVVVSAVIIALLAGVMVGANIGVSVLTGLPADDSYYTVAVQSLALHEADLQDGFNRISLEAYNQLARMSAFSYSGATTIASAFPLSWSQFRSSSPLPGLGGLVTAVSGALDALAQLIFIVKVERLLLVFFNAAVPAYLFPLAIFLRTLPFTRKLGAGLLAICLALYVVYPASLILGGEVYKSARVDGGLTLAELNLPQMRLPPGAGFMCNRMLMAVYATGEIGWQIATCVPACIAGCSWATVTGTFPACFSACFAGCSLVINQLYPFLLSLLQMHMFNSLRLVGVDALNSVPLFEQAAQTQILPFVAHQQAATVILLLLSVVITAVSALALAGPLGGEVRLYGLARLV